MTTFTLDPMTTALISIDLEHGIVSRDVKPHAAKDVIANTAKLAHTLRKAGGTVVYVHVLLDQFDRHEVDQAMQMPDELPDGASDLVPDAGYDAASDVLIAKRQWDGFHGAPDLDAELKRRGVRTVVMTGIATNIGVESTARSAFALGYDVVLVEDAMSTFSAEMQAFAVKTIFPRMGRVRSTAEVAAALGG